MNKLLESLNINYQNISYYVQKNFSKKKDYDPYRPNKQKSQRCQQMLEEP